MLNNKKTYYSISEVCGRTGLEPHVLRYWETEFPQLRPKKNRAGNRAYRDKDIDIVRYKRYLLYVEKYTIPGAKKKLMEIKDDVGQMKLALPPNGKNDDLIAIKRELQDILAVLTTE